jgi:hypothetical protein
VRQEVRGVAHDREAHALNVACLTVCIDERRQVRVMSELPIHLGNREAVILEKAGALLQRSGEKRHIARRVVERLGVGVATVGHVHQQCAVTCPRSRRHYENDLRPVGDAPAVIARGLIDPRNNLLRRQVAVDSALPDHIVARTKRPVRLLRRELDSGDFRDRRSRGGDEAEQAEQKHHHGPVWAVRHWNPPSVAAMASGVAVALRRLRQLIHIRQDNTAAGTALDNVVA